MLFYFDFFFFVKNCCEWFNLESSFPLLQNSLDLSYRAAEWRRFTLFKRVQASLCSSEPPRQRRSWANKRLPACSRPLPLFVGEKNNKNVHECFSDKDAAPQPRPRPSTPSALHSTPKVCQNPGGREDTSEGTTRKKATSPRRRPAGRLYSFIKSSSGNQVKQRSPMFAIWTLTAVWFLFFSSAEMRV